MDRPPLTISLLDDDPSVLQATGRLLRSARLAVAMFADPSAFLEHAAAHHPPVAVLDVCMPVMNGLDVQTRLLKISPDTEVIFLTSHDDSPTRERALTAGAFAFMLKPADADDLISAIKSAVLRKG